MSARTETIQCKDSIVILRRSEDRRRICIKVCVDRFLTALRLSFSSLRGIVRPRPLVRKGKRFFAYAQNDKVGLSGWDDRSRSGRTICSRRCSALRAVRAAASRSGGPQACPAGCARHSVRGDCINIRSKTIVPHPPPHSFERLLHNACCGPPRPCDGRLVVRRRRMVVDLLFAAFGRWQFGVFPFPHAARLFVAPRQPFDGSLRALRPSIYAEVAGAAGPSDRILHGNLR